MSPVSQRLSWSEMARRFVGRKYRSTTNIPGLQAKTVWVVDVNLGGDVAVRFRGSCSDPIIPQQDCLSWVSNAVVLDAPTRTPAP